MSLGTRPRPQPFSVISQGGTPTVMFPVANTMYAVPWYIGLAQRPLIDQIVLRVSTGAVGAGGGVLAGFYTSLNGLPARRIIGINSGSGNLGVYTTTLAAPIELPDLLWTITLADAFATTQPQIPALAAGSLSQKEFGLTTHIPRAGSEPSVAAYVSALSRSALFSDGLPDSLEGVTWNQQDGISAPRIGARVLGYIQRPNAPANTSFTATPGAINLPTGAVDARTLPLTDLPDNFPSTPGGLLS